MKIKIEALKKAIFLATILIPNSLLIKFPKHPQSPFAAIIVTYILKTTKDKNNIDTISKVVLIFILNKSNNQRIISINIKGLMIFDIPLNSKIMTMQ